MLTLQRWFRTTIMSAAPGLHPCIYPCVMSAVPCRFLHWISVLKRIFMSNLYFQTPSNCYWQPCCSQQTQKHIPPPFMTAIAAVVTSRCQQVTAWMQQDLRSAATRKQQTHQIICGQVLFARLMAELLYGGKSANLAHAWQHSLLLSRFTFNVPFALMFCYQLHR